MPVSSYPRFMVQGTGAQQNIQNGTAVMVLNPSTNKYEAATAATFGGGGGGGATSANQDLQINVATQQKVEASNTNLYLDGITNTLSNILSELQTLNTTMLLIKDNQTNEQQLTKIVGVSGNRAEVNGTNQLSVTAFL